MSLLKVYQETNIPALEEMVVGRFYKAVEKQFVILKQEGGVELHQDRTYVACMKAIFSKEE